MLAFQEQPLRLKGRQRLLASLQRITSSHSGGRRGSSRSRAYSDSARGSISCISLSAASPEDPALFGHPLTRQWSTGFATAPASALNSPRVQTPVLEGAARVRYVGQHDNTSIAVPAGICLNSKLHSTPCIVEVDEDYFSRSVEKPKKAKKWFNFWRDLPSELRMEVLSYLTPRQIVRCSIVSKSWHAMCFDGQLWSDLDTTGFYRDIPGEALEKIIAAAGPFIRDLNLRGCVQLEHRWNTANRLSDACKNLENMSLEGCHITRSSIHNFLWGNSRLVHLNLSGLDGASDAGMEILANNCSKLQHLNISWCKNVTTSGLRKVVLSCTRLTDLLAGQGKDWDDLAFMATLFKTNGLERLTLMNCESLNDESLKVLIQGLNPEIDCLTDRPIVPPRKLKHLDLTRCRSITDDGLRCLVGNIPEIEGLQLSKCRGILDATLIELLPTTDKLTHLDLEELEDLTNNFLNTLTQSQCIKTLRHLNISFCENLSDAGMIPVIQAGTSLRSLEMDNTRIGDLSLAEAAAMVRRRSPRRTVQGVYQPGQCQYKPEIGLKLVAYDCQNVTWTGVREILSRNADTLVSRPPSPRIHIVRSTTFPSEIIQLKCFYTYQPTVEEHTKRVIRGDFIAARRLDRKWTDFMMAQEEADAGGAGSRRRRRRAREAQMMHADEEDEHTPGSGVGGGRRRRARSGGCSVM
ncbi:RNI-like protein [Dissoconium aciculare CBS 342.82]|uniref:RNI-like protein n=1 Tax=Dissoconium aciculare CBS 342.82 TaxID=1314786 RepID=A0A6J3MIK0_9PEZI|nr:RNI-like protein [Dissoconium aciculare CBS 342.82]KAF1827751.1 RNI-like protein [Dissoconium aciculare CBS 342.82]